MSFLGSGAKVIEGVSAGLYEAGTVIMAQSQVLVPVDTATLKRSGQVEMPKVDGDSVSVTVGYGYGDETNPKTGDPTTGYAYWVEVRDDVHHAPPTQAHFLEVPAKAMVTTLGPIIEANIKQKVGF